MTFTINNLSFQYKDGAAVFDNQTVSLPETGVVEVRGPNGCGKTTLLKILGGILRVTNDSLTHWRNNTNALFFDENILSPALMKVSEFQTFTQRRFGLDITGEGHLSSGLPSSNNLESLSLGQGQRLILDVALCASKECTVLLDEPLNGLDDEARSLFVTKLDELSRERFFIIASHIPVTSTDMCIRIDSSGKISNENTAK